MPPAALARSAVLVSLFLAGCLSGPAPPGDPGDAAPGPVRFSYHCPPGPSSVVDGVCVGRIASRADGYYETHVAIHPGDPRIVAIGANGMHTVEASEARGRNVRERSLEFFFSEDGGATWRRSTLPYVAAPGANPLPVQAGQTEDPRLEFDDEGVLHVSALVSANGLNPGPNADNAVIYTSTADLGRTWSPAELLAGDADNQQNYLGLDGRGGVFVTWESGDTSAEVAWSQDRGRTWTKGRPGFEVPGCATPSNVVAAPGGEPVFACAGVTADREGLGLRVYAIDVAAEAVVLRAEVPDVPCLWPRLAAAPGGTIAVAADSCGEGELRVARSADGGATWTHARSLDATPGAQPWVGHLAADAQGRFHLFALPTGNGEGNTDRVHVVLSPADLGVVHQATLARQRPPTALPALDALSVGDVHDHYWGGAFGPTMGLAAWSRDGGIDFTLIVPS